MVSISFENGHQDIISNILTNNKAQQIIISDEFNIVAFMKARVNLMNLLYEKDSKENVEENHIVLILSSTKEKYELVKNQVSKARQNGGTKLKNIEIYIFQEETFKLLDFRVFDASLIFYGHYLVSLFFSPSKSVSIKPFLWSFIQNGKFRSGDRKRKYNQIENLNNERIEVEISKKSKLNDDTKGLVRIRIDYEDVIFKKHKNFEIKFFTTSQYIKVYCIDNCVTVKEQKCKCVEQEKALNKSLKKVPKDVSQCDPQLINDEFIPQILSWASSEYKCAPCLRSATKMIATSDFLFIFGGSNPNVSNKALQDVYRFNILTRQWTKLNVKNIPEALISYAICWDPNPQGEYLVGYIFGGSCDPEGIEMSNKLYKFRIDVEGNLNFEELILESDENCKPTPRCGSSMIMDNEGKLYVIGGADDKCYLIDIWVIDMSQNRLKWKTIEGKNFNMRGRYTHETTLINDKIFMLGGGDGEWSVPFDEIDAFDIKTQEFVKIHTLSDGEHGYPHSRQFHSSVTNENDVYLIGGWSSKKPNSNDTVAYADVWKLSPLMSGNEIYYKWTKTSTNLKMSLFFHTSAITSEGCVYTFGGCIDNKSLYPSNKIQRFWINTPTLKQISMFKTLANNPKVVEEFKKREIERVRNKKQKDIFYQDKMENVTVSMQEVKLENFETDDKNAEDNKLGSKQNDHFLNIRELRQSLPMRLIRLLNVMDN